MTLFRIQYIQNNNKKCLHTSSSIMQEKVKNDSWKQTNDYWGLMLIKCTLPKEGESKWLLDTGLGGKYQSWSWLKDGHKISCGNCGDCCIYWQTGLDAIVISELLGLASLAAKNRWKWN